MQKCATKQNSVWLRSDKSSFEVSFFFFLKKKEQGFESFEQKDFWGEVDAYTEIFGECHTIKSLLKRSQFNMMMQNDSKHLTEIGGGIVWLSIWINMTKSIQLGKNAFCTIFKFVLIGDRNCLSNVWKFIFCYYAKYVNLCELECTNILQRVK